MTDNIWTDISISDLRPSEWAGMVCAVVNALSPSTKSLILDPSENESVAGMVLTAQIDQFGNYKISVLDPFSEPDPS